MSATILQPGVSVLIPVYNSAGLLPDVVTEVVESLAAAGTPHEVILVNDGSLDASWPTIEALAARRPAVRGINLMRNYGQHNALLCAIRAARFAVCVTMDDDGQHPPRHIAALCAKLAEGHDVVYGAPREAQHGLLRTLASRATKLALRHAMGAETARHACALRVFRTALRDAFAAHQGPFVSVDVLLSWATTRFAALPLDHRPRLGGASTYTFRKLLRYAMNMMTGFTTLPLRVAIWAGLASAAAGLLILAVAAGRALLHGNGVSGFAWLASLIMLFSGAQLFSVGMIGEYLGRMHFRLLDRPAYSVRAVTPP